MNPLITECPSCKDDYKLIGCKCTRCKNCICVNCTPELLSMRNNYKCPVCGVEDALDEYSSLDDARDVAWDINTIKVAPRPTRGKKLRGFAKKMYKLMNVAGRITRRNGDTSNINIRDLINN